MKAKGTAKRRGGQRRYTDYDIAGAKRALHIGYKSVVVASWSKIHVSMVSLIRNLKLYSHVKARELNGTENDELDPLSVRGKQSRFESASSRRSRRVQ